MGRRILKGVLKKQAVRFVDWIHLAEDKDE
jgi:hypothetical protein